MRGYSHAAAVTAQSYSSTGDETAAHSSNSHLFSGGFTALLSTKHASTCNK
jgi:hypothetical protein